MNTNQPKKYWRLELDFDGIPREEVDEEAKRLIKEHPELGNEYRIEASKTERDHYHVIFLKSQFNNFNEPYQIALESKCDKDWLDLCKDYECFGLETVAARRFNELRQERERKRIINKPVQMILSPFILDLLPATALDGRRIAKVCESIDDPEWQWTAFVHVFELKQHVQIGCRDEAQANRRMKWLSEQGLNFTAIVKRNLQA